MKLLLLHNRYREAGGEDRVVDDQAALLRARGHEVRVLEDSNDRIQGLAGQATVAWNLSYSRAARERVARALAEARPDVVHAHNLFPLLSTSVYDACAEAQVPVVQTLHNFRAVCAAGTFTREGRACEDCLGGGPLHAVAHGCYRGSRLGTIPVARMIARQRRDHRWMSAVARFLAPSRFALRKFLESGFPERALEHVPHFVSGPGKGGGEGGGPGAPRGQPFALYAGRLSAEKGVRTLLEAWRTVPFPLHVAGDGPEMGLFRQAGLGQVVLLGRLSREALSAEMGRASLLVAPSDCYETFGLAVAEGLAHGLPALVTDHGSLAELVEPGVTGGRVPPGRADLLGAAAAELLGLAAEERGRMSSAARVAWSERYSPEAGYQRLVRLYGSVGAPRP